MVGVGVAVLVGVAARDGVGVLVTVGPPGGVLETASRVGVLVGVPGTPVTEQLDARIWLQKSLAPSRISFCRTHLVAVSIPADPS